jgi:hypothetical protein
MRDDGREHMLPGIALLIIVVAALGLWVLIWVL